MVYYVRDMKKQVTKNTHFLQSLRHALSGVVTTVKEERNMKTHLIMASGVIVLAAVLQCTAWEWLMLLHCIFIVMITEIVNTITENLVDVMSQKHYYNWAKKIKDMAAAAVLLSSIYSVIVASVIFVPKLLS